MAKLSVSLDDDLADELRKSASNNVSAFVAEAVRDALDRRRLVVALGELDAELGELDADVLHQAGALFDVVEAANRRPVVGSPGKPIRQRPNAPTARTAPGRRSKQQG